MRIQFNTGRGYSATGQPITAVYNYSNVVMFRDHARGITWTIPVALGMRLDTAGLREFVMWNYDKNNYTDAHWTEDELDWREA